VSKKELPLTERLTALREAVELGEQHLDVPEVGTARQLLAKAGAREALGDATVVALAGATGSGKSTLFNALAGSELSQPGVRRPTTGVAHACVWGDSADGLLDWLEVPRRHHVERPDPSLDGLVLLDLPDHDSTRQAHRLEVDRLVELVDVLVWVLDPQKYADAAVHDRYLAPYAGHAGSLLVVLNQVDRLDPAARTACLTDLRRLLDSEGLRKTPVLPASATTGEGLPELRKELVARVAARRAASDRLTADVRAAATALRQHCGATPKSSKHAGLTRALGDAAGVPAVVAAVERSARRRGTARTGWPLVRWVGKLRPDPLRRLHLSGPDTPAARTSLPAPSATQRAGLQTALRRVRDTAGEGLPQAWRDDLRRTVDAREERLPDRLDRAIATTDLGPDRRPAWQGLVSALQWLLLAAALTGALWLLVEALLGYLQLDDVLPVPETQGLPVPTLLLAAGLLGGSLLAVLSRPFVRAGARRKGRRARRRLDDAVESVVREELLAPVDAAREAHERFCAAVSRAGR
jgi:GTP-binding protein EngB required for normal cell division